MYPEPQGKKRSIHINFNGGDVSGIGGVELLSAALQSAVGVLEPMGSAPTLCRMEAVASQLSFPEARKMVFQMHELILKQFIGSYDKPPKSLVLDFDGTDIRVYGEQEGRSFSSHNGGYAFLPLYVYCGNHLLVSYLRPVDRTDSYYSAAVLSLLVKGLRAHWPEVNIVFRGDAGFYRPLLLSWCERHDVRYIIGYRSNEVLLRECQTTIDTLDSSWHWLEHYDVDLPSIKHFLDIDYEAGSWRQSRRIVAKIERNAIGPIKDSSSQTYPVMPSNSIARCIAKEAPWKIVTRSCRWVCLQIGQVAQPGGVTSFASCSHSWRMCSGKASGRSVWQAPH